MNGFTDQIAYAIPILSPAERAILNVNTIAEKMAVWKQAPTKIIKIEVQQI